MVNIKLTLLATISALSVFSSGAFADPGSINIIIDCPVNNLTDFGDYIAGYGQLKFPAQPDKDIYFKSFSIKKPINGDPSIYVNKAVAYDSQTGVVTCAFSNSEQTLDVSLTYQLTNGKGGQAHPINPQRISIEIPFGLKK